MPDALVERFIAADCEACWGAAGATAAASAGASAGASFMLDWIVPSTRGEDAPLSAGALSDATERAGVLPTGGTLQRRQVLLPQPDLRITVQDGPVWNGYIGMALRVQREGAALPAGLVGYLALVQNVPAGSDGSAIDRRLVRALAGPLPLDDGRASTQHLRALRIPIGANGERLGTIGWVENAAREVVALAQAAAGDCPAQR